MSSIDSIDLHVRSYRSALKSTLELTINSLSNTHLKMDSILHPLGRNPKKLDTAAFIYSVFRLPQEIDLTQKVIIGQNPEVFQQAAFDARKAPFDGVQTWPQVTSSARRRTTHFHSRRHLLAVFAASISDLDDLTNLLIAYQTEWNKFHLILHKNFSKFSEFGEVLRLHGAQSSDPRRGGVEGVRSETESAFGGSTGSRNTKPKINKDFLNSVGISPSDWSLIITALGPDWRLRLRRLFRHPQNLRLQLLAGSWVDYTKTTQKWYKNIATSTAASFHMSKQQIYFVSSNTHSLLNLYTGFALKYQSEIIKFIRFRRPDLYLIWQQIASHQSLLHPHELLYFALRFYLQQFTTSADLLKSQQSLGVITIPPNHYLDLTVQIFPVKNLLRSRHLDPRLKIIRPLTLQRSDALIFNIDYPLGFTAYHVLKEILENVARVKGIYILGKSAVLNSEIGDIQIPRLVFDEHSQNTYLFKNCFNSFFPFPNQQGSILTNQKAVSVLGTFLENEALLKKYSQNNITVIEMESGPYLSAVSEASYDQKFPQNTIVDLNSAPFDIGIINYTSDTPYSRAKNLGITHLSLNGAEPVYTSTLAILQRIINLEENFQ